MIGIGLQYAYLRLLIDFADYMNVFRNLVGAPRIHWVKPDIHSDWKKDWFTGVCC